MDKRSLAKLISTSLGAGYAPKAPGTFGALVGALIIFGVASIFEFKSTTYALIIIAIVLYIIGYWASNVVKPEWGDDPSRVVIDETCGMVITLIAIDVNWVAVLVGFILFRFFDILKPFGIRRVDEMDNNHSVMLDDVLAGIYANVSLQLLCFYNLLPLV